mgnify:CR=1 FL=1
MNVFITGSTGFIGTNLVQKLAESGNTVHALYRSEEKKKKLIHKNIKPVSGDILNIESLKNGMNGCQYVYHTAAFTDVWADKKNDIYDLNVTGTKNVLDTALSLGIEKVIFTSTAGVFGPSINTKIEENSINELKYFLEYERTKAEAEKLVKSYSNKNIDITIVNPTRVYGPGILSKSNSVTKIIKSYINGNWRLIPGDGKSIGNYVFIDDVVNGHILAMKNGKNGERYLLGGSDLSYLDFFLTLKNISGKQQLMFKVPLFMMLLLSHSMIISTKIFKTPPPITPELVKKYNYNWRVSSQKAINDLGYKITPFEKGAEQTIQWIKNLRL